jgi:hypothetical protein
MQMFYTYKRLAKMGSLYSYYLGAKKNNAWPVSHALNRCCLTLNHLCFLNACDNNIPATLNCALAYQGV